MAPGQGRVKTFYNHPLLIHKSTNRFFILLLLDLSSIPRAREGAPGGPRNQSRLADLGANGRKPLFGSLLGLFGGLLALLGAMLRHDAQFCLYFLILCPFFIYFCYFSTLRIIDFHGTVVIFEVFAVSPCDAIFEMFLWPLGASWGPLGPHFGSLWPPSGASWGRLVEDSGASSGSLEGFLAAKAPKMPQRAPKTPPGSLPDTPRGVPDTPRGLPEAPQRRPRGRKSLKNLLFIVF